MKRNITRREMLRQCSTGFGMLALAGLMSQKSFGALRPPATDFMPRARSVIFCYMSGGVSHLDSFDPKPLLKKLAGQPMPVKIERTMFNNNGKIFPSPFGFRQYGASGMPISSMFPRIAESCADDLAVIRSMTSTVNEHAQANYFFHTGFPVMGHPSAGAWINYGLGSVNQDLPGFVVLQGGGATAPHGGVGLFSNGYLPAQHQASIITADAPEPVANITPKERDLVQRGRLDFVRDLDAGFAQQSGHDAQVEAAVKNYETAYRMQSAVPDLVDLSGESAATRKLYGLDDPHPQKAAYARQCLLARRLVERGVRFVELSCLTEGGIGAGNAPNPWDQHGELEKGHGAMAHQVDQPIAALLVDLKQRGLLKDTLVIWAGEFGRTPFSQGSNGRDHNPFGFSIWMAGGGVKGGTIYGETDELGYRVVDKVATVYDLWATVLHLMGLNHENLTYLSGGRNFRLTDVHGNVIREILS
ncbi:MAG: DUF1501 domain-containing protein [Opitutaceae bacterium]|nr:DUF1501 domain-containing protein [Verrucomicrobiales bacterium]